MRCVITLIILLTFLLAGLLPLVQAQALISPIELIEMRTRTSQTYWVGGNEYQYVGYPNSIHYKNDIHNPLESFKPIDETIKPSSKANWDWEVVKGRYKLLIKEDTTVAIGKDGHWAGQRLDGIAYLDQATKDYVILQQRQSVTANVSENEIWWYDIFYGCNLQYVYTSDRFQENIEVTQQARDWLASNPPSSYGLNNQTSFLTFYSEVDWKDAYPAKSDNGTDINWENPNEFSDSFINFIHPIKDYVVATFTPSYANIRAPPPDQSPVQIHKRFFKENDKHWLLFGAEVTELNQLPSGTVVFDPDTFYPDPDPENTSVDGTVREDTDGTWASILAGGGDTSNDSGAANAAHNMLSTSSTDEFGYLDRGFFLFDTNSIADGATIGSATISIYGRGKWNNLNLTNFEITVYASNPASSTALAGGDWDAVSDTAFSNAVTYANWDTAGYNDFNFNASGIAAIDKTGVSKFCTRMPNYDVNQDQPNWVSSQASGLAAWHAEQAGTSNDPKLVVTYVVAPTVVTNNTTDVQATTATSSGNITATGGENCDERGFEWGIATGNYTANSTEAGSFGVGNFTDNLTGLSANTTYYLRALAHNTAGYGYGSEVTFITGNITPVLLPPTNFTATWVSDFQIDLEWVMGEQATATMIRGKYGDYPTDRNDGYLVYYNSGTSCSDALVDLQFRDEDVYYSAWSENPALSWSNNSAEISIGGVGLGQLIQLLAVFLIIGLAFWWNNPVLYILAAPAAITFGLAWFDVYPTPAGMTTGIVIAAIGAFCLARAMEWFLGKVRSKD